MAEITDFLFNKFVHTPALFGGFHFAALLLTLCAAAASAFFLASKLHSVPAELQSILAFSGWLLALLELSKQLFLIHISDSASYDWWYFPFQLCSVPMYLCILLPFVPARLRSVFLTFMGSYSFVSALAALIFPQDFLRPYIFLTLHGFIWHGILLFISLVIILTGCADASFRGLSQAALLFIFMCCVAVFINIIAESQMQAGGAAHSYAAMFYLNPYHISPQPIVSDIQKTAGIPAGLILYILCIILVSDTVINLTQRIAAKYSSAAQR